MILLQIFNNSLYHHIYLDFQNTARGSKKWINNNNNNYYYDYIFIYCNWVVTRWLKRGTKNGFRIMTMSVSVPKNIKYFGHFSNRRLYKKLPKPWSWVVGS
jgi:hypothetical protein